MRALVLAALAFAGCLQCEPLLDVQHFVDPPDVDIRPWTAADAAAWPDVDAAMRTVEDGEHTHRTWTPEREAAFWDHVGVPQDEEKKEVWVSLDDRVFRIRVLTCG